MSDRTPHYRNVLESVERLAAREAEPGEMLREAVQLLHDRFDDYSWVGIYFVDTRALLLGPWKGPQATEHVRIPIGQGICGAAAATGRTEIVDDVSADERYLACFLSTRSEIVVPVVYDGVVVAEIDIDSDQPNAFTAADQEFLEQVATVISPYCLAGWDAAENWDPR
jgi:putative methionine-R-sulfoxide reductase with GAF domain